MPSPIVSLFCKTAECPTSQALLAYHRSELAAERDVHIKDHLAACDFCNAELQLLTQYRSDVEAYSFVEMPSQLRRLAQDLLKTSTATMRGFAEIGESRQLLH
jgi:anti-sigma factor RsiW